ncbi:GntR family transcriptional regulator [Thalassotalea nanhaiensis]|uniref:GntR family transcriptional regulator n=1 Tax=Thalassotalea nanhaiensis TaxID=3065648 RepID=A0ABY9TIK0_9GAMM|nr:GntR family transcriptional regulator [Colwelliaceae bacterium SQ345]
MNIAIDENSTTPIYKQIVEQVKAAVASGELAVGTQLPSIRQIANEVEVNPNTVAKAFKILERDQVIVSKGFRGTFINSTASEHLDENMQSKVEQELAEAIQKLRKFGAIDSEIRNSFNAIMKN